jgi:hypothetical protein
MFSNQRINKIEMLKFQQIFNLPDSKHWVQVNDSNSLNASSTLFESSLAFNKYIQLN